jgi:hypothetical protein
MIAFLPSARLRLGFLLCCFLAHIFPALAQSPVPDSLRQPLFESEDPLQVTLALDFRALLKDRDPEDRPYHRGIFLYDDPEAGPQEFSVKVKTRGNFRLQRSTCGFPPMMVNFDKDKMSGTTFARQNKLKLVTHCENQPERFQENTILEYLIYKSYNLLTDSSFRVRLLEITYVDASGKYDPFTRYGFFIEDTDRLAERLGGREDEITGVHPNECAYAYTNQMAIFQYMVANTDWSIPGLHNMKLVFIQPGQPPVAVPYDFDWSGLIAAPYAKPAEMLPISSVTQRLFRGMCRTPDEFEAAFARFRQHEKDMLKLFDKCKHLSKNRKREVLSYLEEFFATINDPKMVDKEFIKMCRD